MIGPGIRYQRSRRADRDRLGSLDRAVIARSPRLKANHLTPVASVPRAHVASVGEIDTLDRVAGGLRRWSAELDQIRGFEHSAGRQAAVDASRVRSDRGGADSHHVACTSLEWADEAAERREYEHAREWLVAVDALGDQPPEQYRTKRLASSHAAEELIHLGACDAR